MLKLKELQKVSEESYSEGGITMAREKLGPHQNCSDSLSKIIPAYGMQSHQTYHSSEIYVALSPGGEKGILFPYRAHTLIHSFGRAEFNAELANG